MTYRFELEHDFSAPFVDSSGTTTVEFALGYDIEDRKVIVMSVMLVEGDSYLSGPPAGVFDLQFGIRQRRTGTDAASAPDFGAETASKFIPKSHRNDVLQTLLRAIQVLMDQARPDHLTMETYYGHLPPKALGKYAMIVDLLQRYGLTIRDQFRDRDTGIDYWYFSRIDIENKGTNR